MSNASHLRVVHGDDTSHDLANSKTRQHKGPYDYQQQRDIMRGIVRGISPYLTAPQYQVVEYLFSQSVDMNWEHFLTTYQKLEHGDPKAKTKGTGYSQRHLQRILGTLEHYGLITVRQTGRGLEITPNPNWKPGPDTPLASEKRKRAAKKAAKARQTNSPAKPSRSSTLWATTLDPIEIDRALHSAFEQDYPNAPGAWTEEQRFAVAQSIAENWRKTDHKPKIANEFADWLVAVWPFIVRTYEAPKYPEAGFVCRYSKWLLAWFRTHREAGQNEPPARKAES